MAGIDLIEVYKNWDDEKLLSEYAKKADYEPHAISEMEEVLSARNLLEKATADEQLRSDLKEEYQTAIIPKHQSRLNETHYSIKSNIDFAHSKKSSDGVFFEKKVMNGGQGAILGCVASLPMIALVFLVVFAIADFVDSWVYAMLSIFIIGTSYWVYYLLKKNKAFVRLKEVGNSFALIFSLGKELIEIPAPVEVSYYTQLVVTYVKGMKVSKPHLYMRFELPDGRILVLEEMKGALASMPADWELVNDRFELLQCDILLNQHGFSLLHLVDLKRMLDGLNSNYHA